MKAKLVVSVGFAIAFAAGLVVGLWMRQPAIAAAVAQQQKDERSWLARELNLDAAKGEEVKRIWSDAMRSSSRERDEERRRQLRKERDEAVAALIRPSEKAAYDRVMVEYVERNNLISKERSAAFEDAVERTKAILTPEQRAKYEELLKKREQERGGNSSGHGRWTGDRATTRAASDKP
jgi:Spy/CpxP family protein refolding chaperone